MKFSCEKCGTPFPVEAEPGQQLTCAKCGHKFVAGAKGPKREADFGGRESFTPDPPLAGTRAGIQAPPTVIDPNRQSTPIGRTPVAVRAVPRAQLEAEAAEEDLPGLPPELPAPKRPPAIAAAASALPTASPPTAAATAKGAPPARAPLIPPAPPEASPKKSVPPEASNALGTAKTMVAPSKSAPPTETKKGLSGPAATGPISPLKPAGPKESPAARALEAAKATMPRVGAPPSASPAAPQQTRPLGTPPSTKPLDSNPLPLAPLSPGTVENRPPPRVQQGAADTKPIPPPRSADAPTPLAPLSPSPTGPTRRPGSGSDADLPAPKRAPAPRAPVGPEDSTDLPAPKAAAPRPGAPTARPAETADLPAPKAVGPKLAPTGPAETADLPAPKVTGPKLSPTSPTETADLPAPRAAGPKLSPAGPAGTADLPAPKAPAPKATGPKLSPAGPAGTADLPAPKSAAPRATGPTAKPDDTVDLPAPKAAGPRSAPTSAADTADLLAPKRGPAPPSRPASPSGTQGPDLLAPKRPTGSVPVSQDTADLPAPRAKTPDPRRPVPPEVVDLPGPRATAPDLVAPKRPSGPMPSAPAIELEDLPGTRAATASGKRAADTQTTALQPKRGVGDATSTELQPKRGIDEALATELQPKRGIDEALATELQPKRGIDDPTSTELQPKRGIDALLDEITPDEHLSPGETASDLLVPKGSQAARDVGLVPSAHPRPDEPELVRPKRALDALLSDMTPMPPHPGDSGEVALDGFALEDAPGATRKPGESGAAALRKSDPDLAGQLEPSPLPSVLPPPRPEPEPSLDMVPKPPKKRRVRFSFIVVGSLVLFTGVAMAYIALTDAKNSIFGDPTEQVAVMNSAKNFLADDTVTSSHKAVNKMHNLLISDQKAKDARALETEAHLIDVMAGIAAELRPADDLIADMDAAGDHGDAAETARAMRSIVGGNFPDAEAKLQAVLARSPKDAMAQTALGWTHLAAGNAKGALADFKQALAIEPSRTAAHVGVARAAELLGDSKTAGNEFAIAFKSSPQHLGAEVGRERYSNEGAASEKRLQDAIKRIDKNAGPHDLVDAWTLLGTRSYQAGRYDEAQERLKRAITQDPQAVGPRLALAHALCDADKAVDAVTPIDAVLAKEPKNLEALFLMVNAQLANHQPALAEPFVDRAFAIAPKDPRTFYWKGRVAESKGGSGAADKAAAAYKDAVAADPHFLDGYVALSALYRGSKPEEALATLKRAEVQVASDPLLSTKLAEVYLGLGDATHAESCLRAVTTANPTMSRARLDLSQALVQLGRLDDADKELKDLATRDPRLTGLAERRAQLAVARKQLDEAAKLYVKALAEPSPRTSTVAAAAKVQLDLGHFDEARKLFDRVVTEEPRNIDAQLGRARIELAQNHYIEAIQAARKSLTVADNPVAHLISGQANEKLGKLVEARTEYSAAATGATEFDARIGLARMLVARGAVKDAHTEAERAAKLQPGRAEPKMIMGDCESELGQHDKARRSYEEAVALDGNNAEAAFKLGRADKDAGKLQPAIGLLEKATKLGGDKATFAPEAWLLLAESLREARDRDPAVRAFKKYLEIAPPSAPERKDVQQTLRELGEK